MRLKIILVFVLTSFFLTNKNLVAKVQNNIVLKIESEVITNFEIKNKILMTLTLLDKEINQKNINALKEQSLESLIQHKLRKIELSKYNIKDDINQIEQYLNSISSNNIKNLKSKFKNNKVDYELFLDEIKTQLKWQKLIFQIYSKKIAIDKKTIDRELTQFLKQSEKIEEYWLSEIEIFNDNSSSDQKKIMELQDQIKINGFKKTAMQFSVSSTSQNAGDLGWISSNSLSTKIYNIIKKMNIGDISQPIIKQNTILFLKLNDKRKSKINQINLAELRKNLINQKKNELFNLYSNSHLSKLKNNSLIEYR